MQDAITWQMVVMAAIAAAPAIIAALAALRASHEVKEKLVPLTAQVGVVHELVNGSTALLQSKLDAALSEIGKLRREIPLTTAQAPVAAPPVNFETKV